MTVTICCGSIKIMNKLLNNSICRSCLSKKGQLINPHTEYDPKNELTYVNEYYLCTNILIKKTDSLPKMLCQDCVYQLQTAYQFQLRAKQSNDALLKCANISTNNNKKEVFHNNNAAMRVQSEHGYSFISLTPFPVSSEITPNYTEWNCNDDINLKITDKNNYIIRMDDRPDCGQNEDVEKIKYSILEIDGEEEFPFNCVKCGDTFDSDDLLEAHITQKHAHTPSHEIVPDNFQIKECIENFATEFELDEHKEEPEHFLANNFHCSICGETFVEQTLLDDHFISTHQDEQQGDDEEDNKEYVLIDSVKKTPKILKYLCSICGKNFTTNQRLRIHTYTHTGERNYDCDLCSKKFVTEFRLRSHRRTHTGERPYECPVCKLRFAQSNALKCHKRVHTGEKPYECRYCPKKFSQNTILKTHMTLHTGKTIPCPDCDKKFSRASYLILHRREHTGEKPYACDRCPNRYKQKSHLDRHIDIHNGVKHKCTICHKEYSKQYSLKMHMFTHTNEKPFNCPHCTATFTRSDRYKSHLKMRHRDVNK